MPDVMNSKKWQDLLQHIQRQVVQIPCANRPLAVVLKHLRFAKQRFDSATDPIAKVAFMLLPIATMLAYIGSGGRRKLADRQRAKELLKKLDGKFALAIGVSADWGLVTQAFLRLFDQSSHDIAKTYSEIKDLKKTCEFCSAKEAMLPVGTDLLRESIRRNCQPLAATLELRASNQCSSHNGSKTCFIIVLCSLVGASRCCYGARPRKRTSRRSWNA